MFFRRRKCVTHPSSCRVDSCGREVRATSFWTFLLTMNRRDARAAFAGRASRVSRASEGRALSTPDRHTRERDTRGCLSPSPRISSPTGASARRLARVSEPKLRRSFASGHHLGTYEDASGAHDRPLEPHLRASRRVRSHAGPRVDRPRGPRAVPAARDPRSGLTASLPPPSCSLSAARLGFLLCRHPTPSPGGDGTPCSAW